MGFICLKKHRRFLFISSLTYFALTGQDLSATTYYYYVTQSEEPGTDTTSSCTTCTTSGNTCCTFLDALSEAQGVGADPTIITITPSIITYTGEAWFANETAYSATINSAVSSGTIINFNEQSSVGGYVFQPTYTSTSHPGVYFLENVVFQNGTTISLAGGSITLNGISTAGGTSFSGNTWYAAGYNGQNPTLAFANSGNYSQPFTDAIQIKELSGEIATTLQLTSLYTSGSVSISGTITSASTLTMPLNVSGNFILSGNNDLAAMQISSGTVEITGTSDIEITYVGSGSTLSLFNSNSLASGNAITLNSNGGSTAAELELGQVEETYSFDISLGGASTITIPEGYATLSGDISGTGPLTINATAVTLTGNNTYSGGSVFNSYAFISGSSPFGTGAVTFAGEMGIYGAGTVPNTLTCQGGIYFCNNPGTTITLTGNESTAAGFFNIYNGGTIVIEGDFTAESVELSYGNLEIIGGSFVVAPSSTTSSYIYSDSSVTLSQGGTISLSTSNLSLDGGTVSIGTASTDFGGFSAQNNTVLTVLTDLVGDGTLTVDSGGTVVLQGNNAFKGGISVTGVTLQVSSAENLGLVTGSNYISLNNGAVLELTGSFFSDFGFQIGGSSPIDMVISAGSNLLSVFVGPCSFSNSSATVNSNGDGIFGLISTTSAGLLPVLNVNAGTFIGNLSTLSEAAIHGPTTSSADLIFFETIGGNFSGEISGNLSVSIGGDKSVVFPTTGNTYTGTTTIGNNFTYTGFGAEYTGSLSVSEESCFGNSSGIVGSGGTLEITGQTFSTSLPISLIESTTTTIDVSPSGAGSGYTTELSGSISGDGALNISVSWATVLFFLEVIVTSQEQ